MQDDDETEGELRHNVDCECGHSTTAKTPEDAEINHLLHYRQEHDLDEDEREIVTDQLEFRGYDG